MKTISIEKRTITTRYDVEVEFGSETIRCDVMVSEFNGVKVVRPTVFTDDFKTSRKISDHLRKEFKNMC